MAINYYKKSNPKTGVEDFYEANTNRYIGPTEYGQGAGFTEQAAPGTTTAPAAPSAPTAARTSAAGTLGDHKSSQGFLGLVKEAIQRKQGFNKDIQGARDYWRTQQADPMTFTDERLQLLSPAEQQSLRERRYATAGAHLAGLSEEETYRGGRLEDVLGSVTAAQEAAAGAETDAQIAENRRLDMLSKRANLGYDPTITEVYGSYVGDGGQRVGIKQGGTAAWRNNNPGNIKYSYGNGNISGFAQSLIDAGIDIQEGSPATDGGSFIAFPSEEIGDSSLKQLLTSGAYTGLSVDEAMKKWSGGGYGAEVMTRPMSVTVGELSDEQLDDLISGMKKREGWKEGTLLEAQDEDKHVTWSESAVRSLAEKSGKSSTELWDNYTDAELDALAQESGTSFIEETVDKLNTRELLAIGLTDKDVVKDLLTLKYEAGASNSEIEALMAELGIKTETSDGLNVLEELEYLITIYTD